MKIKNLILLLIAACTTTTFASDEKLLNDFSPCHVKHIPALSKCAMFSVPENWQEPQGKNIELHVAVVPPSGGQAVKTPMYVLAGGPGQSASSLGSQVDVALRLARRGREVVLVDQRGAGKSTPFVCKFPTDLSTKGEVFAKECLAKTDHRPQFYTSAAFMRDLEAVRIALGHDKIVLWGGSYGTRAALLYVRDYPENVEAMLLDAVTPPATLTMGLINHSSSRAIEKVINGCRKDTACTEAFGDLREDLRTIKTRLDLAPVNVGPGMEKVNYEMFVGGLRGPLYSAGAAAMLPYVIDQFAKENSAPWAAITNSAINVYVQHCFSQVISTRLRRLNSLRRPCKD